MKIVGLEAFTVTYKQHCGSDLTPVQAAKVSTGKEVDTLDLKGRKLLNYLAKNNHMTPFEMIDVTFIIECPVYIRTQVIRHRTFSYNEWSGMYAVVGEKFYVPNSFRKQGKKALELTDEILDDEEAKRIRNRMEINVLKAHELYTTLLEKKVTRDLSRLVLPQNMMTKFWMKGNLRNWMQFCALRVADDAHYEHQHLGEMVFKELLKMFPICVGNLGKKMFNHEDQVRLGLIEEKEVD